MEAGLRITNPVFGATASSAIKAAGKAAGDDKDQQATVRAGAQEWEAISKKVLAILRNPQLSLTERKRDLQQTLAQLQRSLASHGTLFNISAFDFAGATAAVAALRAKTFGTELRLADDGTLYRGARKLGTFQQLTADVLQANQIYAQHGILREFVISVSTPPSSEIAKQVSILTRQRQPNNRPPTLPPQLDPVAAPVPPNRPQYLIDSGVGESAFALDLVPAADRRAGPLLQTEFGPSYVDPAMLRRDLGWQRAAPRGDQHSVVVLGDTLQTMQTLVGQRNVRRIFINNVNAHYSPAHYATLAQQLSAAIAPGGQVEVQWDSTPEYPDRPDARPGDRGHIDGPTLAQALAAVEGPHKRRFRVERQTPIRNYAYSIEPSRRPGGAAPGTKVPPSPVPEARWVFVLE